MESCPRKKIEIQELPGRAIQKIVGKDGPFISGKITMGFARYSEKSGKMEPHRHAEEVVYIIDAKDGWVRHGDTIERLGEKRGLSAGMTLHFKELEWHVFEYEKNGFVDIIFIYGQVDNIRPEEILKNS